MTRLEAAAELIPKASDLFGPITTLVNNAGIYFKKPAVETTEAEFHKFLRTLCSGLMRSRAPSCRA